MEWKCGPIPEMVSETIRDRKQEGKDDVVQPTTQSKFGVNNSHPPSPPLDGYVQ